MPKFKKQVRNFLNNSPFKMTGKSTLLKASTGNMVSPLKETEYAKTLKAARAAGMSQFDYNKKMKADKAAAEKAKSNKKVAVVGDGVRSPENQKFKPLTGNQIAGLGDSPKTTPKKNFAEKKPTDSKPDATGTKTETVTGTQRRAPGVGYSGSGGGNSGNTIRLKKEVGPTGERVATKPPEKIASAEATRAVEAGKKRLQDAKGQEKNMQDKNKLKADIKTLRKNKKGYTTGKGDTKSNKDLLNEKRQAKRKKGKAIREYKTDPNALKIDKVKKSSAAKMYKKKK